MNVWTNNMVPNGNGGNVTAMYGGPALISGHYYQFRATSWRKKPTDVVAVPISTTEDLRGVFIYK